MLFFAFTSTNVWCCECALRAFPVVLVTSTSSRNYGKIKDTHGTARHVANLIQATSSLRRVVQLSHSAINHRAAAHHTHRCDAVGARVRPRKIWCANVCEISWRKRNLRRHWKLPISSRDAPRGASATATNPQLSRRQQRWRTAPQNGERVESPRQTDSVLR